MYFPWTTRQVVNEVVHEKGGMPTCLLFWTVVAGGCSDVGVRFEVFLVFYKEILFGTFHK